MSKVLILGASGGIARIATDLFLKETEAQLTLYLRDPGRLKNADSSRVFVAASG
jgi:short-subunit dehydrogenase